MTPIEECIAAWHDVLDGARKLEDLLDDDCVLVSPIVFTPQEGKALTMAYLGAAGNTLSGKSTDSGSDSGGGFRYTKQILDGDHAVLEFETTVDGKFVNGVDIITCNDDGKITEFRVMIRPLQAVNAVHAAMMAALDAHKG